MQETPRNASMQNGETETKGGRVKRGSRSGLTRFFFPHEQVTVWASSQEEAEKKLAEIIKNKTD